MENQIDILETQTAIFNNYLATSRFMSICDNRIAIKQAFFDGKIKAICGYPGIGKTYLERHDHRFVDGWFSEHYYSDKIKGTVSDSFPNNYLQICRRVKDEGNIILSAMHPKARECFEMLDMPYLVIYPNFLEKERYFNIYDTRPDVREWIGLNKAVWDSKIDCLNKLTVPDNCFKDEIPIGMSLSQYLFELGIINKTI